VARGIDGEAQGREGKGALQQHVAPVLQTVRVGTRLASNRELPGGNYREQSEVQLYDLIRIVIVR
jgi:hypothetical protein